MEELYYQCSENKGADQLRGNHKADLRLCLHFYTDCCFSLFHDAAQILVLKKIISFTEESICIYYIAWACFRNVMFSVCYRCCSHFIQ